MDLRLAFKSKTLYTKQELIKQKFFSWKTIQRLFYYGVNNLINNYERVSSKSRVWLRYWKIDIKFVFIQFNANDQVKLS